MKLFKTASMALLAVALVSGCTSAPNGPKTLEQLNLAQDDSKALTISKLGGIDKNLKDAKIDKEKMDLGGYSAARGVLDLSTGALGVGLSSASGLTGAINSFGIGLLMAQDNGPQTYFSVISIVPKGQEEQLFEQYILPSAKNGAKVYSVNSGREPFERELEISQYNGGFCLFDKGERCSLSYTFSPSTKLTSDQLNTVLDVNLPKGEYSVVNWWVHYPDIEAAINLLGQNNAPLSYLYVPKESYWSKQYEVTSKYTAKVPYLIAPKTEQALFFVKAKS